MKIKIITGFRKDQFHTIDSEEAHKAYYLFLNPEKRGVFKNGVAIQGSLIQSIEPDYHATMGWNETHQLDSDDWNEINRKGVAKKMKNLLSDAKEVVRLSAHTPEVFALPLSQVLQEQLQLNG